MKLRKVSKHMLAFFIVCIMLLGDVNLFYAADTSAIETINETTSSSIFCIQKPKTITAGDTISTGGTYKIAEDAANGIITVNTKKKVTLIGKVTGKETALAESFVNLSIDCAVEGVNLTIKNLGIQSPASDTNLINFTGNRNKLFLSGLNYLDADTNLTGKALIHVGPDTDLAIDVAKPDRVATLYFYKRDMGAAIGGDQYENNGTITINGGNIFGKGSRQGAVIGQGAATGSDSVAGTITINGGNINLIGNARGAIIGGSAGSTGASAGGEVYITGGTITLNVDFSGAAIGGGGYDAGNDSDAGNVYISGGSIRTFIDENAISIWGVPENGVNDKAITASKYNHDGEDKEEVQLLPVDVSGINASTYVVKIDGVQYYKGGLHQYGYVNESKPLEEQIPITDTTTNWTTITDTNLYLYATKEDHIVTVNGRFYSYSWDDETGTFVKN